MSKHDWSHCPGSICVGDETPNWEKNVIWYPGEKICGKKPYCRVQKIQLRINKRLAKGKLRNSRRWFTYETLAKIKNVTVATKGGNPERDTTPKHVTLVQKVPALTVSGGQTRGERYPTSFLGPAWPKGMETS